MSTFVKICGLRDAAMVAAAVDAGADAVGFVFAMSPREIGPQAAREAASEVPASVQRVAVMRHPSAERWQQVLDIFEPDVLQTDLDDLHELDVPPHVRTWPVIREGDSISEWPAEFVYEGRQSGVGATVDWQQAAEIARKGNMVLAGGLDFRNVAQAVAKTRPWGVDVSSGVETAPGEKDPDLIKQFITAVRTAEAAA